MPNNSKSLALLNLLSGPIIFILCFFVLQQFAFTLNDTLTISTIAWVVSWWIGNLVPMAITAMLPIVILPLAQVINIKELTSLYAHPIVFLMLGGFFIGAAIEKCNLHKRIALTIIKHVGTSNHLVIAGFMIATAFISMWISNTATTIIMLPIALSVLHTLADKKSNAGFATSLMLSIAYAANIGGTATLIGTPTNMILAAFIQAKYDYTISFARWFLMAFPFVCVMLFITWLFLTKILFPNKDNICSKDLVTKQLAELGKFNQAEKMVSSVFVGAALLWIFRNPINELIASTHLPIGSLSDTAIAIAAAIILTILPTNLGKRQFILDWKTAKQIPWEIVLLFGGGLTIAASLGKTEFVHNIGDLFTHYQTSSLLIIFSLTAITLLLTELMSNMALTSLLLPIIASIAASTLTNPLLYAIPMILAASCAFMMPIATPPNAIIFASNKITIPQMMKAGFVLNIIAVLLLTLLADTFFSYMFSPDLSVALVK